MPVEYSKTGSSIRPFTVSNDLFAEMGRIIRACSEIEDIIALHLCNLAKIGEAESLILLGRVPVSAKLRMAATIANAVGGEVATVHNRCFDNDDFKQLMKCRNTVAHGLLLGQNDEGGLAFRTVDPAGADAARLNINVISWDIGAFGHFAEMAENSIPELERLLGLQAWRKRRREQDLLPHRKSQPKEKQGAKQQPPPESSQAKR